MSTRRFVQELEYTNAKGLDTTSPVGLLRPGYVREARNVNLGTTGGYEKRGGIASQLTTAWSGTTNNMSIRQATEFRYINSEGTQVEKIFYGNDDGTDARVGKEVVDIVSGDSSITNIKTGLSADTRGSFIQIQERLFFFDGESSDAPFVYEGASTTRSLGLQAPTVDPVLTAAYDASANLAVGTYIVAYTYVIYNVTTGATIAESNPSELITVELEADDPNDDNRIEVQVEGSGVSYDSSVYEAKIRIYRSVANGSIAFLATEIDDTAGTHNVNLDGPDGNLEDIQLSVINNQLEEYTGYSAAKFPIVARNRVFVAHNTKNEVRFSTIGQEGPMPESFPAVNFASTEGKRGSTDTLVGLGVINGVPIVLKDQSVGRLEEVGLPEYTRAEDAVTYVYREISDTIGATNHFAQTQVFGELLFLGRDNIYATDGARIRAISEAISSTIRSLDFSNLKDSKISAVNDTKNKRVYIQVFQNTGDIEPNLTLVGDYDQYPEFRWTTYEEGSNKFTHPGIRAGCFMQFTNSTDGSLETYFGNTDNNGQYYLMNTSTHDEAYEDYLGKGPSGTDILEGDDLGIFFRVVSRPYDMQQPLVTKLFKNTRAFVQAEDETYELTICSIFDLAATEEQCQAFTIPGIGGKWEDDSEEPAYGWVDSDDSFTGTTADTPLTWAGPGIAELTHDAHRKAKFMQLVFKQYDKDAPVTLLGWGASGAIFGGI